MDFTIDDLRALFDTFATRMAAERDALCALDGAIGDGDHGIAMEQGTRAASEAAHAAGDNLQDLFNAAAKGFLNAVGASSGPLYATAFIRAGKVTGQIPTMPRDNLRQVIAAMAEGIAHRGKAVPGQKTMLDAWVPAATAALSGASPAAILDAAQQGRDATRTMPATMGRAARLGDRALGHPDPGAASAAMLIQAITAAMQA
jgi:phosphoenolpyruvate---glycerone phosphotransferase subunit DhaL